MNGAPIDLVIDIIKRHKRSVEETTYPYKDYKDGMLDAFQELITEFEGFKKLFN